MKKTTQRSTVANARRAGRRSREIFDDDVDARIVGIAEQKKAHGFWKCDPKDWREDERDDAPEDENRRPAEGRDEQAGDEAAERRAQGEATKHGHDHDGMVALRAVL